MNNKLNQDIEARDKLIYGKYRASKYKFGNIQYFKDLAPKTMDILIKSKFADPDARKNNAPSFMEFYDFMNTYPGYKAHGYTVNIDDDDYGVYIEGVEKGQPTGSVEEFKEFMTLFGNCSSFNETTMYCWFE